MYLQCFCFFFKQKTAYEIRINDWSSDVCSSDLGLLFVDPRDHFGLTQIVADSSDAAFATLDALRAESVVTITGEVVARSAETVNANLPTGEVEVRAREVSVQSAAAELPLPVAGEQD